MVLHCINNYVTSKNRRDNGRDVKEISCLFVECSWSRSDRTTGVYTRLAGLISSVIVAIITQYIALTPTPTVSSPYDRARIGPSG